MLTFGVTSDLYEAGHGVFGPYNAEQYYVMAEDEYGNRLRHFKIFKGCKMEYHDGEQWFRDIRAQARERAEKLMARMVAAGRINHAYWEEMPPAYGSQAYTDAMS